MEIKGTIISILPLQSGQSKNGQWRKQEFIIETSGQYPKKICFNLWGDKIDQFPLNISQQVTVVFDLESREYNSRWYTEAKAFKLEYPTDKNSDTPSPMPSTDEPEWLSNTAPEQEIEDFPF